MRASGAIEVVGRLAFARISSAIFVRTKGYARSCQPSMNARILASRSLTDLDTGDRMARRSTIPNHTSTRFMQEAWAGVKCTTNLGLSSSHAFTFGYLCAA